MLKENEKLLGVLAQLFLTYRDPDEAYFRIVKEVKHLYNKAIYIDIKNIQELAYNETEEGK